MATFGQRLKQLRKNEKLTQAELADKLLVKRPTLTKWETGKSIPRTKVLKRIAEHFDVTIDFLLGDDEHSKGNIDI